jgi:hypothetical protein
MGCLFKGMFGRIIFGPTTEEVTGGRRELYNKELPNL